MGTTPEANASNVVDEETLGDYMLSNVASNSDLADQGQSAAALLRIPTPSKAATVPSRLIVCLPRIEECDSRGSVILNKYKEYRKLAKLSSEIMLTRGRDIFGGDSLPYAAW